MFTVVVALIPALLFGMYNVGYQNYLAANALATASFWEVFAYG
jgi:Na+-transporting NADH:ubiquinone oxidoreductase subunit B